MCRVQRLDRFVLPGDDPQSLRISDQQLVIGHHALGEDGQDRPVRGAAVRGAHRAHICGSGEVRQAHPGCEGRRFYSLLAGSGGVHRLRDLCGPAGVGAPEIFHPEEAEVHLKDHTVVSTAAEMEIKSMTHC